MNNTITLFAFKNRTLLVILASLVMAFGMATYASAVACNTDADCGTGESCSSLVCVTDASDTSGELLGLDDSEFSGEVSLGQTDLRTTIGRLINTFIGLLGIVAVIIILIGGFQWMTAGGEEEKVESAKKLIFAGIAGLAVILAAYAIAAFVITQLTTATDYGV